MRPRPREEPLDRAAVEHGLDAVRTKLGEPLARAASAARVLADHAGTAHAAAASAIVGAVSASEAMLADVVEFWQIAALGGARVQPRRVRLRPIGERVVDAIERRFPTHGLQFRSDDVEGQWDPDALAALLSRVVVNGVQHGPSSSAVHVRVRGLGERAEIEVRSGAPLSADVPLHRLFEPFACARPRATDGETGLGLGLFLARETARAHGGRIDIESDRRRGTVVRVDLPRG